MPNVNKISSSTIIFNMEMFIIQKEGYREYYHVQQSWYLIET